MDWVSRVLEWFTVKEEVKSYKLEDDELELLTALHRDDRPIYEIAAVMYKSEQRVQYEINKLEQKNG